MWNRIRKEKKNRKRLPLSVFCMGLLLFLLTAADLCAPVRLFSQQENRLLAQRPELSWAALLDGSFGRGVEACLTDQFVGRDGWISVKTYAQLALGEREIHTICFVGEDTLIERHTAGNVDAEKGERKLMKLAALAEALSAVQPSCGERADGTGAAKRQAAVRIAVLLVPTADCVWQDKLPRFAEVFDQLAFLQAADKRIAEECRKGNCIRIPAEQELRSHAQEEIYYRTDHHWTTLGAYYGYAAYCAAMGLEFAPPQDYAVTQVTDQFLGTLHSRVNVAVRPDRICIYSPKETQGDGGQKAGREARVTDLARNGTERGLYAYDRLKTKDAYSFFLGGNDPLLRIDTGTANGKRLLLIKDSYANCFVPFLTEQYAQIFVADPRYYRGSLEDLAQRVSPDDVLILYDVIHFINNF